MRKDLIALPDNSRVWIYQADRFTTDEETPQIQDEIIQFTHRWQSHGMDVNCYGHLFHRRFLVLVADETDHVSGCSIDSSVHFIQKLGSKYQIDFFDRMNLLYFNNESLKSIHLSELKTAISEGRIEGQTQVFNNLVNTKKQFINEWVCPIEECWLNRYLPVESA